MRIRRREFTHDYSIYHFGYTLWGEREKKDKLADLYESGFLPYSGIKDVKDTMYMARSIRVPLENFIPSSENRRILKKFENRFDRKITSFNDFDTDSISFRRFCNKYFKDWHGIDFDEKLRTVLGAGFITEVVTYTDEDKIIGYVLLDGDKKMSHYWFSFYDTEYIKQSLGMWMMINEVLEAKKANKSYMYLGTGYGEKARYKMNFKNIEYWDGSEWVADIKKLKGLVESD
ncbi:hypothetical protein COW81_00905 [Candidatus Campbellbacteria bacterium CG22_combo_CG10-13_8_21_14_all_36_13]|uniref:N-end rule aminoacyl transferase C-terminal domain-containing protein n=1 Tax=Candidatus Campbellbacteria bacterium CG22_combo_CG10-13_8_21_14_all_36_13 TaxID=1974529 RepID=A0A2H0E0F7_9BACT|nr:MAG: hypothetical protein COW81_00905 [Candidatus Campbellbacteria bacterium CG22_combo_CG10-13_8_21_14_all_36_13]